MENTNGTKSIDTATLRRLLPLWAMAAGFDLMQLDNDVFAVRITKGHPLQQIGGWFGKIQGQIRITDGTLLFRVDERNGFVYAKIKQDSNEGGKH